MSDAGLARPAEKSLAHPLVRAREKCRRARGGRAEPRELALPDFTGDKSAAFADRNRCATES